MPGLQRLYKAILGQALDRRNFQRKMLSYGIFTDLQEARRGGARKAPRLYVRPGRLPQSPGAGAALGLVATAACRTVEGRQRPFHRGFKLKRRPYSP